MAYITEDIIILNTRTSLGHNVSRVNFWQGQAFWLQAATFLMCFLCTCGKGFLFPLLFLQ